MCMFGQLEEADLSIQVTSPILNDHIIDVSYPAGEIGVDHENDFFIRKILEFIQGSDKHNNDLNSDRKQGFGYEW
jgi:hypothetical protein